MKELAIVLGIVLALVIGGIIGYACGVQDTHKAAVAAKAGHWTASGPMDVEFHWGQP